MKNTATLLLIILVVATILSLLINVFFVINNKANKKQNPINQLRWAVSPKSTLGGISFYVIFILTVFILEILSINHFCLHFVLAFSTAFCFGFLDDFYRTSSLIKFIGQIITALLLMYGGTIIQISENGIFNECFTILWVIGMMNSINMLDNMDGIVSSVSLVSLGLALMIIFSSKSQNLTDVILITAVIGALIGFLFFNWNPARIYMGDTGSQFLGAFLSWVSIQYFWQFRDFTEGGIQIKQFLIPALAFTISLMDTVTVTLRRLARGVSPFVGGRDHTTHHLAYLGIKDKNVVRILIAISIVSALVAYNISDILNSTRWHWSYSLATIIFYVTIFFGLQYFYEVAKQKINQPQKAEQEELIRVEGFDEVLN
jgi:UDP-GlcNAc:undecaprenyl-phosphate/decaprenyl-phosphate GlcNAc-1-phosphate transferase